MLEKSFNYNLKKPCKDCPFLQGNKFARRKALTVERVKSIIKDTVLGDKTFACHKTTDTDNHSMCAGALAMTETVNPQGNAMHRIAQLFAMYKPNQLKDYDKVYAAANEMIEAYELRTEK